MLVAVLMEYLKVDSVNGLIKQASKVDQFTTKFYLERTIDILQSIPSHKGFIKDEICSQSNVDEIF